MINDLPTIFEVVTGNVKQSKEQSANQNIKSKSSTKMVSSLSFDMILFAYVLLPPLVCA